MLSANTLEIPANELATLLTSRRYACDTSAPAQDISWSTPTFCSKIPSFQKTVLLPHTATPGIRCHLKIRRRYPKRHETSMNLHGHFGRNRGSLGSFTTFTKKQLCRFASMKAIVFRHPVKRPASTISCRVRAVRRSPVSSSQIQRQATPSTAREHGSAPSLCPEPETHSDGSSGRDDETASHVVTPCQPYTTLARTSAKQQ